MKQYKGIIFNSVNIGLLNGELGRVVSANNIRTAVVSPILAIFLYRGVSEKYQIYTKIRVYQQRIIDI